MSEGKVYLVGAGPGDPQLITLRGVDCLRRADVVLYDYLANPDLLHHAERAEKICLGRHGHTKIWSQDEINRTLVDLATGGKTVVRLKSGDPAVFARGAEEAEHLARHAVDFEIVPGITAALAASSCAGIPVTHRDLASAVALVTGQQKDDAPELDFGALASFPGTLVFYMGVTTVERWTTALISAGKSEKTPAAIIRRCSFPDQTTIRCTLAEVVDRIAFDQVRPPVIVVVGEVTNASTELSWFEQRPLFGQSILVTRPAAQSEGLVRPLTELGAEVLVQPAIDIRGPDDWSPVDAAMDRLNDFDWIVFSSTNGVEFFIDRLLELQDVRKLGSIKIASIGPSTTAALGEYSLRADLQPTVYRAEALAADLVPLATNRRFLLVRASRGREVLAETLTEAGATVEQVVAYRSSDVKSPDEELAQRLARGAVNWVTITSSAIAKATVALFGESLRQAKLVSISPITSQTLREAGFEPHAEAETYDMPGIVDAIRRAQ